MGMNDNWVGQTILVTGGTGKSDKIITEWIGKIRGEYPESSEESQ